MFSRWGAFVYRFRRPIALIAVVIALAEHGPREPGVVGPVGRRLARRGFRIGRGVGPARRRIRGGQELGHRALPLDDARRRRDSRPSSRAPSRPRSPGSRPCPRSPASWAMPRPATRASSAPPATRPTSSSSSTSPTRSRSTSSTRSGRRSCRRPASRYQLTGYGPITKDSAEQSEKDLQKAELVSLPIVALVLILVFASLVAAGMPLLVAGLAIPSSLALDLHRRPAGRDEHLRAQHRDDARARPGDRLLAVHRQPLPRGTASRPDRRRGRRARRRDRRQGRRVQRHRGRDRAVRPAPVRGAGHPLHRHRRLARRALLGRLRADLPAGRPRHARPSRELAVDPRPAPSLPPGRRRRRGRADVALGARRARGHAPPDRRPRSRPWPSC